MPTRKTPKLATVAEANDSKKVSALQSFFATLAANDLLRHLIPRSTLLVIPGVALRCIVVALASFPWLNRSCCIPQSIGQLPSHKPLFNRAMGCASVWCRDSRCARVMRFAEQLRMRWGQPSSLVIGTVFSSG